MSNICCSLLLVCACMCVFSWVTTSLIYHFISGIFSAVVTYAGFLGLICTVIQYVAFPFFNISPNEFPMATQIQLGSRFKGCFYLSSVFLLFFVCALLFLCVIVGCCCLRIFVVYYVLTVITSRKIRRDGVTYHCSIQSWRINFSKGIVSVY